MPMLANEREEGLAVGATTAASLDTITGRCVRFWGTGGILGKNCGPVVLRLRTATCVRAMFCGCQNHPELASVVKNNLL